MAGRIGVYIHSDNSTPDKGGCLIVVRTDTDFASRTTQLKVFADRAAMFCYGIADQIEEAWLDEELLDEELPDEKFPWEIVATQFPHLEQERVELSAFLKETVTVTSFAVLTIESDT
jgi:hypothetical protein